ncbi:MAG: PilZ domain-containing protein [Desulfobacterales bacterium]|nr:PilZ domain-containing protein [Desulfobacterales bacterium]
MPSGAEKKTEIIPEPNIEDFDLTDLKIERKGPEDAVPGEDINKKPMENSRKYKRNKYPREVVFTVEGVEYHGFIDNMGAAGLFIRTDESLSVGKAVELTFPLSNKANQVKFFAEIVRTTDDGIGVTFLKSRGKPL